MYNDKELFVCSFPLVHESVPLDIGVALSS